MGKLKLIIALLSLLLITSGCLAELKGQRITIQKRVGEDDIYEDFKEVNKRKEVRKAKKIVENADWENAKVEMARYADYQFQFPFKNNGQGKIMSYSLWVSPNGENLEIVIQNTKYVKLTKQDSAILYEILTGEELIK